MTHSNTPSRLDNVWRAAACLHPFFRDLGLTVLTGFAVVAAGVVVLLLLSRWVGAVALAEYLLVRRVAAWFQAGAQTASGVGLPRYVARSSAESREKAVEYFGASLVLDFGAALVMVTVLLAGRQTLAHWLFGSAELGRLVLPLALLLGGLAIHSIVYGYYRGLLRMSLANALQAWNLVVIPVVAVIVFRRSDSAALILSALGLGTLISAAVFGLPVVLSISRAMWKSLPSRMRELVRYGFPRLQGDVALNGLLTLGPIIVSHFVPISRVGGLLLGLSILSAATTGATSAGVILLSKVSEMLGQDRSGQVESVVGYMVPAILDLSVFISLQLLVFSDVAVRAWVGKDFLEGILAIRILLLALPFYLFYVALRAVIDAKSVTAYNTRNVAIALAIFLVGVGGVSLWVPAGAMVEGVAAALLLAFVALARLTERTLRHLFGVRIVWGRAMPGLVLSVLFGLVGFMLRLSGGLMTSLPRVVLFEAFAFVLFVVLLKKAGSSWLPYVWNLAFMRPALVEVYLGRGQDCELTPPRIRGTL